MNYIYNVTGGFIAQYIQLVSNYGLSSASTRTSDRSEMEDSSQAPGQLQGYGLCTGHPPTSATVLHKTWFNV